MKIIKEHINKAGKRIVTVEVDNVEVIRSFKPDAFYLLGDPLGDVVYGSAIIDSWLTVWDQCEQRWII